MFPVLPPPVPYVQAAERTCNSVALEPSLVHKQVDAVERFLSSSIAPPCCYFVDDRIGKGLPLEALSRAGVFAMTLASPAAEDALLACGAALADGVPSLYLVSERKHLPWFLKEADQTYPGLVAIVEGDPHSLSKSQASAALAPLAAERLPTAQLPQARVDTFVGCMMSGLTEQQYADGRQQLEVINTTLASQGSTLNFCEGINVGSQAAFGTPHQSLGIDLEAVRSSRACIFYAYDGTSRPSGMWVELGAALAWHKSCKLLVPDSGCLPEALRGKLPGHLKLVVYGSHEQLLRRLASPKEAKELLEG